jgi:hypothetical protein
LFFLKEKLIFTTLKKIITILTFLLAIQYASFSQARNIGVDETTAKVVKFYPNPAADIIRFELQKGTEKMLTLQLYNFMGKKVSETQITGSYIYIPLDGFLRGVYVFQLRNKEGKILDSGRFQVVK